MSEKLKQKNFCKCRSSSSISLGKLIRSNEFKCNLCNLTFESELVEFGEEKMKNLSVKRVIQRNLVYATNIHLNLVQEDDSILGSNEYFGQYGTIVKLVVNKNTLFNPNGPNGPSVSCYVTYSKEEEALDCIKSVDGAWLEGKLLRASFGTTKYCTYFIRGQNCVNPDCMYLHELGSDRDTFTKEDMAAGKHHFHENLHPHICFNSKGKNILPPPPGIINRGLSSKTDQSIIKEAPPIVNGLHAGKNKNNPSLNDPLISPIFNSFMIPTITHKSEDNIFTIELNAIRDANGRNRSNSKNKRTARSSSLPPIPSITIEKNNSESHLQHSHSQLSTHRPVIENDIQVSETHSQSPEESKFLLEDLDVARSSSSQSFFYRRLEDPFLPVPSSIDNEFNSKTYDVWGECIINFPSIKGGFQPRRRAYSARDIEKTKVNGIFNNSKTSEKSRHEYDFNQIPLRIVEEDWL